MGRMMGVQNRTSSTLPLQPQTPVRSPGIPCAAGALASWPFSQGARRWQRQQRARPCPSR
eukprot:6188152-Pyramimonas_sp.AAC.1